MGSSLDYEKDPRKGPYLRELGVCKETPRELEDWVTV